MLDQILEFYKSSKFDIIKFIPDRFYDPKISKSLCNSIKFIFSICTVVKGENFLELGNSNILRSIAYLSANPEAEFTSIRYVKKPFQYPYEEWTAEYLKSYNYKSFYHNEKTIKDFHNELFDIVSIDTNFNNEKFYDSLIDASKITKWLLISNYSKNLDIYYELCHFLFVYKDIIEFYFTATDYSDDILLKINQNKNRGFNKIVNNSIDLKNLYDSSYYLHSCGGCDSFTLDGGAHSSDPRILVMLSLVFLFPKGGKLLDLGCGRGEVSLQAALNGFDCTSIDYSKYAINIAKKELQKFSEISNKIKYFVCDITNYIPTEKQDVVVASDVIEHMSCDEVIKCFEMVRSSLTEQGLFIIHTFPNAWYYNYNHKKNRRKILSLGGFLPTEPRSRFEKSMHINEQNPRILLKQLNEVFPYVLLWFNSPDDPVGSLIGKNGHNRLSEYRDLMAVASNNPIDIDQIKDTLSYHRWDECDIGELSIEITECQKEVRSLELFDVHIQIRNFSKYTLHSLLPHPVNLSYHWIDSSSNNFVVFDGLRTSFCNPIRPRSVRSIKARCMAPEDVGVYKLRFSLVQERHTWFDQSPFQQFSDTLVKIL